MTTSYTVCLVNYEVGLQKILSLLEADDADVRIHAVKVVANLAAEGFFLESLAFFIVTFTFTIIVLGTHYFYKLFIVCNIRG